MQFSLKLVIILAQPVSYTWFLYFTCFIALVYSFDCTCM